MSMPIAPWAIQLKYSKTKHLYRIDMIHDMTIKTYIPTDMIDNHFSSVK